MSKALRFSEEKTRDRFERRELRRASRGYSHTAEFAAAARHGLVQRLAAHIKSALRVRDDHGLRLVAPENLAVAGLASVLNSICLRLDTEDGSQGVEPGLSIDVGLWIQHAVWEAGLAAPTRKQMAKAKDGRERHLPAKRRGYRKSDWDVKRRLQVGTWFLSRCLEALPDVFELWEYAIRARKPQKTISLRNDARETIHALRKRLIFASPVIAPSKESLNPWTGPKRGGFWHEQDPIAPSFVRGHYKETAREIADAFANGAMKQHVAAVNALQDVPFRINEPVLNALKKYGDKLVERGKLKLSKTALDEDIAVAENLRGSTFRIPINCDFRGRAYGLPHFNFQREDHIRALFLFDRGVPRGENEHETLTGLFLARHLTGRAGDLAGSKKSWVDAGGQNRLMGTDKTALGWVDANSELIAGAVRGESNEWLEADEPFSFLAACIEHEEWRSNSPDRVSRLPATFDATCSGLQHICAMTRDERGAPLVNLTKGDVGLAPTDIYTLIAENIADGVADDVRFAGIEINPKLVKQSVMTYVYGATDFGRKKQIEDVLAERHGERVGVSWQLGREILKAIEETFPRAAEVKEYLLACTRLLGERNAVLQWTTPTGFPWANRYYESKNARPIQLLLHGTRVERTFADGHEERVLQNKVTNAIVPNLVHALDASYLLRTVNACAAAGITDLLTVNDCFACPLPQARKLLDIAKREFVRMYEEHDPLAEIRKCASACLGHLAPKLLPPVPARGSFDLKEVLGSIYFIR